MNEDVDGDLDDATQCGVGPPGNGAVPCDPQSMSQVNAETEETVETVEVAWGDSMVTIPLNLLGDVIPAVSNESTITTISTSLSSSQPFSPPPSFSPPFSPPPRPASPSRSPQPVEDAGSSGRSTPVSIREKAIHYRKHKTLGAPPADAFHGRKQEKDKSDKGSLEKLVETATTVAGMLKERHQQHEQGRQRATTSSSNPLLGTVQFALAQVPNESHLAFLRDILKICEVYKNGNGPSVIHDKDGKVVI